jgi:ABC-2 type transport system permease protein
VSVAVAGLDLGQRRRALIAWALGFGAYVLVIVAMYPSFKDSTSLNDFVEQSPGMAALFGISGSLTDPAGWLNANIYANFLPLILLLVSIGYGAHAIAGQEDRGTLALVQVLPISRPAVIVQKMLALKVQVLVVALVCFLVCLAGRAFEVDVSIANLAWTTLAAAIMAIDFGLLALAVGALTGERGHALAVAGGLAAAFYLIASLAPLVGFFDNIKWTSLWYWSVSDNQLVEGVRVLDFVVLIGAGIAMAAFGVVAYRRHDLRG